jgi:hypothetical protein
MVIADLLAEFGYRRVSAEFERTVENPSFPSWLSTQHTKVVGFALNRTYFTRTHSTMSQHSGRFLKTFDSRREGKGSTRFVARNRKNPDSIGFSDHRARGQRQLRQVQSIEAIYDSHSCNM